MRRVLITGPRDYADPDFIWSTLDALHAEDPVACLIQGEAAGADAAGKAWAEARGIATEDYPANWNKIDGLHREDLFIGVNRRGKPYNKLAGFARNSQMLRQGCPTHVVGFPDPKKWGGTPGTGNMLGKARRAKANGASVEVLVYHHPTSTLS